jgi:hypothetical protein
MVTGTQIERLFKFSPDIRQEVPISPVFNDRGMTTLDNCPIKSRYLWPEVKPRLSQTIVHEDFKGTVKHCF